MILVAIALAAASGAAPARRCGWLINPTPGNWWLKDRAGEWTIGTQGGNLAPGFDRLPDMSRGGWVVTNGGSYGHGCACLNVTVDRRDRRVTRVFGGKPRPLAACRRDPHLPRP